MTLIGIDASPKLRINRLVVTGDLGCDIRLGPGVNIVKAEPLTGDDTTTNDCGKTCFMNLIKYGIGDRDRFSEGNLAQAIDTLFLEVQTNDRTFTVERDLNKPNARVAIYESKYRPDLQTDRPIVLISPLTDYSDFMLESLGMPNIRIPLSTRPGTSPTPITMQQYMRLLYMDQRNGFQEIMHRVQPEWMKTKLVRILLGMAKEDVENIRSKVQELVNQIAELVQEIEHITDFLAGTGSGSRLAAEGRREEVAEELRTLGDQISDLKVKMRGGRGLTDELRDRLNKTANRMALLNQDRARIDAKRQDFRSLVHSLTVDRERIRKTVEASHILGSVEFTRCPRCMQTISSSMREREASSVCMLCNRELLLKEQTTEVIGKDQIADEEIRETKRLLEGYEARLRDFDAEIDVLSAEREAMQRELDQQTTAFVSPFVDELELLLRQRNDLTAREEVTDRELAQWKTVEDRRTALGRLRKDHDHLVAEVTRLDTGDEERIHIFATCYERFLRGVDFPGLTRIEMDRTNLMPLINKHPYTEDTGSGMVSVKVIAYHHALLRFSLENPCYFPRFLMLDSPRQFDLNQDTYEKMLLQFYRLHGEFDPEDFQVIITTRGLPQEMEGYVIERLNSRNRMLLRPEGQREQSLFPE